MKNRAVAGSACSVSFVLICILGGAPTEIVAQEPFVFGPGVRLRVTAPDCALRGQAATFRALRADTLILESTECPLASVTRLDVSGGQKSHTLLGAGIGLAAGGLGAVVFCEAVEKTGCELVYDDNATLKVALIVGAIGAVAGGLVGHFIKTDRWEEVPLERLRVSLTPQRDGRFAAWVLGDVLAT
jgi:hypothetical protein